jgi:peptidoglycan/LPS O-acetylase OafA/YrhL
MNFPEGFIYLFFPLLILIIENLKESNNFIFNFVVYIGEISFTLYLFNYAYRILHMELGLRGAEGVIIYSLFLLIVSTIIEGLYIKLKSK